MRTRCGLVPSSSYPKPVFPARSRTAELAGPRRATGARIGEVLVELLQHAESTEDIRRVHVPLRASRQGRGYLDNVLDLAPVDLGRSQLGEKPLRGPARALAGVGGSRQPRLPELLPGLDGQWRVEDGNVDAGEEGAVNGLKAVRREE